MKTMTFLGGLVVAIPLATAIGLASPAHAFDEADFQKLADTNECEGCDLSGADLTGLTLRHTKLIGANLAGANLSGMDLAGSKFTGANLSGANLRGAGIGNAYFDKTNLTNADVRDVSAYITNLNEANMTGAQWNEDSFGGALMRGTILPDGTVRE